MISWIICLVLTIGGAISAVLFAINSNYTGALIGAIIAIVGVLFRPRG
ncbi:hypothetical protein ACFLUL_01925 [Chloroflexota bacterium]